MSQPYYYCAASLPMIDWDGTCPMSTDDFLVECQRLLAENDYVLIEQLLRGDDDAIETDNTTACSWIQFNRHFRNELAWFRAQRANKDPLHFIRGAKTNEPALREAIQQASKMPNLLEAEKFLDKMCWQFLDDLSNAHYYDLECIIVYGLKLKILQRHQEYHSPKGRGIFDEIRMTELPEHCIQRQLSAG